jgi:choline dehydrogenase
MVSGVGPSTALKELGIEVLVDKPGVGQGMWDHVTMSLVQQVDVETLSELSDAAKALKAAQDYNKTHSGPLTSNGADYIGIYLLLLQ